MMIIDDRVGSKELLPLFQPYDVNVQLGRADSGDIYWWGNGHDGPTMVGVERKVISDMISSMRSNRLSGFQLPKLLDTYGWVYLVLEGVWQCGDGGEIIVLAGRNWIPLRVGSQPVLFRELDHYLATLEHRCGVTVKYTSSPKQTVSWLVSRYKWWTDKEWDEHRSHEAIYAPHEVSMVRRRGSFTRRVVGPVEVHAAQFPGVARKAYEFGKVFRTVHEMVNAEVVRLESVDGIGKKGARRIYDYLRGR